MNRVDTVIIIVPVWEKVFVFAIHNVFPESEGIVGGAPPELIIPYKSPDKAQVPLV